MLMDTAERHGAPSDDGTGSAVGHLTARHAVESPDRDIPADRRGATGGSTIAAAPESGTAAYEGAGGVTPAEGATPEEQSHYRPLWVEEPARRRRLPDPVRTSAVRAVLIIAVTLILAMVAFLCTMAGSWLAFPMVLSGVAGTVVATWAALDVWVTRQVWNQRHGVVSAPSSTAHALRRERRKARRQARVTERVHERIRRREGAGQVAHP
jgi:hypothetical protein